MAPIMGFQLIYIPWGYFSCAYPKCSQTIGNTTMGEIMMSSLETRFGKQSILATTSQGLLPSSLAKRWQLTPLQDTIKEYWESAFFRYWQPLPVKDTLVHTTTFRSKEGGLKTDRGEDPGDPGVVESIHNAESHHASGHVKAKPTSVLAHSSKRLASLGVQRPAGVQKNWFKVPMGDKLLDALSRTSLIKET